MRTIVVISLELSDPSEVADVLLHLDPPNIPHFGGQVRVAVMEAAEHVLAYLDEEEHPS